jgi:tetratricopeptide (TPR) repeat protein
MQKGPLFWACIFGIALLASYFGFTTISPEVRGTSTNKTLDITGVENLVNESTNQLKPEQKAELDAILQALKTGQDQESLRLDALKSLSGFWFSMKEPAIAGAYAKQVAEILKTDTAWSITGTTFMYGLEEGLPEKRRAFCFQGAVAALENAISLNPNQPDHSINLALTHIKMPGDNPMKGILMLRELEEKYPDYEPIQFQLVELAIKTGQWERAKGRLEKLLSKNKENVQANCLMADVLEKMNMAEEAKIYKLYCK